MMMKFGSTSPQWKQTKSPPTLRKNDRTITRQRTLCTFLKLRIILLLLICFFSIFAMFLPFFVGEDAYRVSPNANDPNKVIGARQREGHRHTSNERRIKAHNRRHRNHETDDVDNGKRRMSVARGPNPLPMSETPALMGARRGHIQCDVNVDHLAYWNDPQGDRDRNFVSPFAAPPSSPTKYLTFEPDRGGWNNIRMSMENMVVIAAASGRTLVLPPEQPMYLLKHDPKRKQRGFADFFSLQTEGLQRHVPIISAEEFIRREGGVDGQLPIPPSMKDDVWKVQNHCEHRDKSKISCFKLYDYYREVGYVPQMHGSRECFIFDEGHLNGTAQIDDIKTPSRVKKFCAKRRPVYFDKAMRDAPLMHFKTSEKEFRILTHFYAFILFTEPAIDNFYKRLIRDYFHYHDSIFCVAGKIVNALQKEGMSRGFTLDSEGGGGYSSMHIRRGDFQWKNMRISGDEWYENTKEHWLREEIIYIATDERNRTFFDPLAAHHDVRFLGDFWNDVGLEKVDPNYFGMVDAIVASRGRIFVGTFFSSFTAYIGRMRGYHGMPGKSMWYGQSMYKTAMHKWVYPHESYSAREFPLGWTGIDGDKEVTGVEYYR